MGKVTKQAQNIAHEMEKRAQAYLELMRGNMEKAVLGALFAMKLRHRLMFAGKLLFLPIYNSVRTSLHKTRRWLTDLYDTVMATLSWFWLRVRNKKSEL